jgi:peptidoglycan/xylan/chitin deacetylase (PgdA/CDA1 family)
MNIGKWFKKRGFKFILKRGSVLLERYGISPIKSIRRIENCLAVLKRYNCSPTIFTPGIIVKRFPTFSKQLQQNGAEIGIHSYYHIDLKSISLEKAIKQLDKANMMFSRHNIGVFGFRCPYLSYSNELKEGLPEGLFGYSSNQAIWIDVVNQNQKLQESLIYKTLERFYNPKLFSKNVSIPRSDANLIELPVSIPDDIQLHDGLNLNSEGISQAWIEMLHQTHLRGELFTLIFHPELGSIVDKSFDSLLQNTMSLQPIVWIARLRDICDWWKEKATFGVEVTSTFDSLILRFTCSSRATILVRGQPISGKTQSWDGAYRVVKTNEIEVPIEPRPFVGIGSDLPDDTVSFLKENGYILEIGEKATRCGIYIDATSLHKLSGEIQLINYIEESKVPLVRYWRWPDGAKSALSITGDLDALSLLDYASRLFAT